MCNTYVCIFSDTWLLLNLTERFSVFFYATTPTIFSRYIYMLVSVIVQGEQTLDIPVYRPLRVQCVRTNDNWDILIEK